MGRRPLWKKKLFNLPPRGRFCPEELEVLPQVCPTVWLKNRSSPSSRRPVVDESDLEESLLAAVEVSYLEESDLEPLIPKTGGASAGPAKQEAFIEPSLGEEPPLKESKPFPVTAEDEPIYAEPSAGEEPLPEEVPLDEEPSLPPENAEQKTSPAYGEKDGGGLPLFHPPKVFPTGRCPVRVSDLPVPGGKNQSFGRARKSPVQKAWEHGGPSEKNFSAVPRRAVTFPLFPGQDRIADNDLSGTGHRPPPTGNSETPDENRPAARLSGC